MLGDYSLGEYYGAFRQQGAGIPTNFSRFFSASTVMPDAFAAARREAGLSGYLPAGYTSPTLRALAGCPNCLGDWSAAEQSLVAAAKARWEASTDRLKEVAETNPKAKAAQLENWSTYTTPPVGAAPSALAQWYEAGAAWADGIVFRSSAAYPFYVGAAVVLVAGAGAAGFWLLKRKKGRGRSKSKSKGRRSKSRRR